MYEKGSTVKPLSASNFDRILAKTSQPTFVKFYAPWCGHCQSLEPEYERAAKRTLGIAKFYAVNCDEDKNKPLCARYNVQGFPTLKVFTEKRTKRGTRRSVDYQGERKSSAMVKFARSLLPNLSRKLASDELDGFVASTELPKAVLLTDKKTTAELWKGVSAHFDRRVEF
ncbi:thioredoxin-domain-containing protein, partial [Martensiomyces pterosporus]